jgi:hypothetical protein
MIEKKLAKLQVDIDKVERSYQDRFLTHLELLNTQNNLHAMRQKVLSQANIICSTLNSCRSKEMEQLLLE